MVSEPVVTVLAITARDGAHGRRGNDRRLGRTASVPPCGGERQVDQKLASTGYLQKRAEQNEAEYRSRRDA